MVRDRLARYGVTDVSLIPGSGGIFDITVEGRLAFSRHAEGGRFPVEAEIDALATP